ncbi:hypothetical protein Nepgr_010949 [Nepenthes gracilis]|uniref:Uncharacterized protein n=1 Tax=Nepenthes gracilis TaxID=150966 RepID=A0AAD3SED3_NEPGR|nr:hypothetical protein Nepgr_010949 [Nepenthes gracilis]
MAKCFNVTQKQRRALIADRKRGLHGDPATGKLKKMSQPLSMSGKRKRKLLKKWRREQKELVVKGLVTMQDIEMVAADGSLPEEAPPLESRRTLAKFHLKRSVKLSARKLKQKGKNRSKSSVSAAEASVDAMAE